MSEANTLVSETSKLSAGARIFRGPQGPEILVLYIDNVMGQRLSINFCTYQVFASPAKLP